jgi:spermidine synthase
VTLIVNGLGRPSFLAESLTMPRHSASQIASLFLVSVLGLFLELMLLRWVGTEVRIFAYLQNTVLVVCFLGLGLGCLTCRRPFRVGGLLGPLLMLTMLMAVPTTRSLLAGISERLRALGDLVIWGEEIATSPARVYREVGTGLALTALLMALIGSLFVPIGRLMARRIDEHPRAVWAYSVNVAGSLLGTWLFVGLSAVEAPPVAWFATAALLTLPFLSWRGPAGMFHLLAVVGMVALAWLASQEPGAVAVRWSPYQKLVVERSPSDPSEFLLKVNNVGYQAMLNLSPAHTTLDSSRYPPELRRLNQYEIPYRFHPRPRSVLIVGAGTGNDVAGALRAGVERVTAVEIDPAIIELGRKYHPERPYDSPRVRVVNDDARAFLTTCREQFDVIVFGLLDAHTTTAMTNARLDHYVYTKESVSRARSLLAAGGVMTLCFEAQRPYIADRMERTLRAVFGHAPIGFRIHVTGYGWGGVMFVADASGTARRRLNEDTRLADRVARWQRDLPLHLTNTTPIATDDWPYIYLERRRIPRLYDWLAGMMLVLLPAGARLVGVRGPLIRLDRSDWHFFFLGAAFLLLEVQNVSKASVALGNTWSVNAGDHLGHPGDGVAGEPGRRVPAQPAGSSDLRGSHRQLPGLIFRRSLRILLLAPGRPRAGHRHPDLPAHALQRHPLHPLLRRLDS